MNCSHLQKPSLTSVPKQPPMICRRHQDLKTKFHLKNIKNFISTSEKNDSPPISTSLLFVPLSFHDVPKTPTWTANDGCLPSDPDPPSRLFVKKFHFAWCFLLRSESLFLICWKIFSENKLMFIYIYMSFSPIFTGEIFVIIIMRYIYMK